MNRNPRQRAPKGPGGPMGGHGMMVGEKPKNFKKSIKRLFSYLKPFKKQLYTIVVLAAVSTIFAIYGPRVLMKATNKLVEGIQNMITGAGGGIDFGYIGAVLIWLAVLYIISSLFSYLQGFIMAGIAAKVSYNLRNALMAKLNKLPLDFFNKTSHGEVLSRITNDVDLLSQSMNHSFTQIITSVVSIIGVLIMMITINWKLTLIALATIPVTIGLVMVVVKFSQKHFKGQQKYLGTVNGIVEEIYGGHVVVKAFNGEKKAVEMFELENEKLYNSSWKAQFISGLMMPVMKFIGNIGYVVICIVGAAMTVRGSMTIGGIQAFIQYLRSFTQPISQIGNISNQLQMTIAASERIFEFLDEGEEQESEVKYTIDKSKIIGDVRFENVRFGYDESENVIKDFTAEIKPGQKIAIVGPTGAGKTTMVKLLMRFYDLKGGVIYLDGRNITEYSRRDIRNAFGMVLQDTWLYNSTIMDNIRYGRLDATDKEVIEAAKTAQADHFIRTLPGGYNMVINEEAGNISQGQKQLLTIARAVLSDNKVLILDEATSSVDTRTEILIQRAMDALMKGRTSFIIAHRLSTIKNADLILCMQDGDIVEKGNHSELMEKNGFYANLYNSQFDRTSV